MTILVVGASGATGRHLVDQLLKRGHQVRIIVRSPDNLPDLLKNRKHLAVTKASLLDLTDAELAAHAKDCDAVASCLGHNMSFKGVFGKPRRLVTDATRRLCKAIKANQSGTTAKFVLMNTVANRNRDLNESIPFGQKIVIALLRVFLPPHPDNEQAAEYLRTSIGKNDALIEWSAVRPSGLIEDDKVTDYTIHPSPVRSIFDDGEISRINVGHFMADLITNDQLWAEWKGRMPVIYNEATAVLS